MCEDDFFLRSCGNDAKSNFVCKKNSKSVIAS